MNFHFAKETLAAKVGSRSLVGCGGDFPRRGGNYFDFADCEHGDWTPYTGRRCVNMWAENLEEATKRFLPDGLVAVDSYWLDDMKKKWCIVVDPRIPKEWLLTAPYFCDTRRMPLEMLRDLEPLYQWDSEKMLEFYDPVEYYDRRGQIYEQGNGWYSVKSKFPVDRTRES